jgi:hypothetical protein
MTGNRRLNYGADAADAKWRSEHDTTNGKFIIAEDIDGGTVLLEYDESAGEFVSRGPVNMNGNAIESVSQIGSGTDRFTGFVDTMDANSVSADDLSISNAQVQTSLDGLIVPVAPGLGVADAIDPSATSTPMQDAIDVVNAQSNDGSGTVLYPPTGDSPITVGDQITGYGYQRHIGWGTNVTVLKRSNSSNDFLTPDTKSQGRECRFDGLTFEGHGIGAAIGDWFAPTDSGDIGHDIPQFNLGTVEIRDYGGAIANFDTVGIYGSTWHYLRAESVRKNVLQKGGGTANGGGPGNRINYLIAQNGNGFDVINVEEGPRFQIGYLNIGGDWGRAARIVYNNSRYFEIGGINYESSTSATRVVQLEGDGVKRIGQVNLTTGADYVYRLGVDNGTCFLGPAMGEGNINTNVVNIANQPADTSWYHGDSSDIDNNAASSTGLVRSLGTAGTGNG